MMDFRENIDAFLLNELDEENKLHFIQEMKNDSDFAAEVEFHKKIMNASLSNHELQERIAKIAKEEKKKKVLKYIFAGVLLLSILAMVFMWYNKNEKSEPQLFALEEILDLEYDNKSFTVKGNGGNENKLKEGIALAFNKKEYSNVLIFLDSLERITPLGNELKMLKGNCYYEISAYEEALVVFKNLIEKGTRGDRIYAKYYSILVYLKENRNLNPCKSLVDEIITEVNESGFNFEFIEEVEFLKSYLSEK